jgi:2-isopropylmalate synthase
MAYARVGIGDGTWWGAGRDTRVLTASVRAVVAAANRARSTVV